MSDPSESASLENYSLDDVIGLLLSAIPIGRPAGRPGFILGSADSLKAFAYYAKNRDLWPRAKPIQAREINELLQALASDAPEPRTVVRRSEGSKPIWNLRRVEAHRFAGLHRHCAPDGGDPAPFVLDLATEITLISGFNGAGKTALLSAIIWCLTGKALRSQHMPDTIHEPIPVEWTRSEDEGDEGEESEHKIPIPPIIPIPSGLDLAILGEKPKLDTWVRLTFRKEDTGENRAVTRRLVAQTGRRIAIPVEGLDELGISPLAIEVGTLMPGIAAHMRFDEKTDFAQAIAQLTGMKPLEDLGRRIDRVVNRLRKDERLKTEESRSEKLIAFDRAKRALLEAWRVQYDLGDPAELPPPGATAVEMDCATSIASARSGLERLQRELASAVELILGRRLELLTKQDVDGVLRALQEAIDQLRGPALGTLPSLIVIRELGAVSDDDARAAAALIADTHRRAGELAARLADERQAARWQLYARVAAWHRDHHPGAELASCPVCGTNLDEVPVDGLVDLSVRNALDRCREADADIAKSATEWLRDEAAAFLAALPPSCRGFADRALPDTLEYLYRQAFVDELIAQPAFSGRLQPLRESGGRLWRMAAAEHPLPAAEPAAAKTLPTIFVKSTLATRMSNVTHALNLASHRTLSKETLEGRVKRYVGAIRPDDDRAQTEIADTLPTRLPLRAQIDMIRRSVQNTAPIVSLLRQLDELDRLRRQWETENTRHQLLARAATALEPFLRFPDLVYEQVSGLISTLDRDTRGWLKKLYRPHYNDGPNYSGFDPAQETGVGLRAGIGDMRVPAHQVMNSSLLRACVWAFLFSLWGHVRKQSGGLNCILLDDPQTHFDPINSENLASAILTMPAASMHPIITSNDSRFVASIQDKLPARAADKPTWTALRLDPVSSSRLTASISPAVEEIRERRDRWREDHNNVPLAQEFVERVRVDAENRLWNLLATDPLVRHSPTLANLMDQLRGARTRGERPFNERPFEKLLDHHTLKSTSSFYAIINKAHHRLPDVTPFDAAEVDKSFDEAESLLRSCAASYARFMGRLTREDDELLLDTPPSPTPAILPDASMPVLGTLSARSSSSRLAAVADGEFVSLAALGAIALYAIRAPTLGTLALSGQVVLASLEREARDGDPVIAICGNRTYARRLCKDGQDVSRITLAADRSGTERVPPSIMLPASRTCLLPIVGVLYDVAPRSGGRDEATSVDRSDILSRKLFAAHVVDDSAHPIIRDGDMVLMEPVDGLRKEQVVSLEGWIVAVAASGAGDSFGFLKRMGQEIAPGLRIFENIGLNGSSVCIGMGDGTQNAELQADALWRVQGVLRLATRPREAPQRDRPSD